MNIGFKSRKETEMRTGRARISAAAAIAGVVLGSGAMALAAIPAADGTISACFKNSSGDLRVIDAPAESCKNNETAIQWNQAGPPGPQGPPGEPGPAGVADNIFANVFPRFVNPDILVDGMFKLAAWVPAGLNPTQVTQAVCAGKVWASRPSAADQTRGVRSFPPVRTQRPSGLNAACRTGPSWAQRRTRRGLCRRAAAIRAT
jgi:hypothetical protein